MISNIKLNVFSVNKKPQITFKKNKKKKNNHIIYIVKIMTQNQEG